MRDVSRRYLVRWKKRRRKINDGGSSNEINNCPALQPNIAAASSAQAASAAYRVAAPPRHQLSEIHRPQKCQEASAGGENEAGVNNHGASINLAYWRDEAAACDRNGLADASGRVAHATSVVMAKMAKPVATIIYCM